MKKVLIYADEALYPLPRDNFANYVAAFESLGAEVLISADPAAVASADCLLLPGGEDVHPSRYGQEMTGTNAEFINQRRDEAELGIVRRFVEDGRPIIGICRGEQLLNVYFGGTLMQHIPNHGRVGDPPRDSAHEVLVEDELLQKLYGERFSVNSAHHQVIDRVGDGLRVIARSTEGYVEGIRHETLPVFAVQWHPERMCLSRARVDTVDGAKLLGALLDRI